MATVALSKADAAFLATVQERGGEVLAPTNPYEVARFSCRKGGSTAVIKVPSVKGDKYLVPDKKKKR